MKPRMTGFGGFSRKLFATLLVSAMMLTGSNAADNSIYIDQAGDNTNISVTQDGAGNAVEGVQSTGSSATTPAVITGGSNQVTINQVGTGDVLNMGVRTSVANGATSGNSYSYTVTGNNSTATIDSNADGQGTSASNTVFPGGSSGAVQYNNSGSFGAISSGTSGQILTSAGSGAAPTWTNVISKSYAVNSVLN